jgi:hypothetical protein
MLLPAFWQQVRNAWNPECQKTGNKKKKRESALSLIEPRGYLVFLKNIATIWFKIGNQSISEFPVFSDSNSQGPVVAH